MTNGDHKERDDLERVIAAATALSGSRSKAMLWLDIPLQDYYAKTPRELVEQGRVDVVLVHIAQLESGSTG